MFKQVIFSLLNQSSWASSTLNSKSACTVYVLDFSQNTAFYNRLHLLSLALIVKKLHAFIVFFKLIISFRGDLVFLAELNLSNPPYYFNLSN